MYEFKFPDVGEGITEGEIVKWKVKVGDRVKQDQVLVEVETDKAVVQLPSPASGKVLKISHKEGDTIRVGEVLVVIEDKGKIKEDKSTSVVGELKESGYVLPAPKEYFEKTKGASIEVNTTKKYLPKAVDSRQGGVMIKKKYDMWGYIDHIPLKGVRKAIAKNMVDLRRTASVTHMDMIDATKLVELVEKGKGKNNKVHITFLPFIIKAVVKALQEHPFVNSSLVEETEEIILKKYYNIGVAVDTEDGLIVPVIKGADKKSILEIAKEISDLAEKTKKRTVDLMDLKGGTFTITNVGSIGGIFATPVINYPEAAILATGKIHQRPVIEEGKISVKWVLPVSLTFDHRIFDGAEAARFVNTLKKYIEAADF